MEEQKPSGFGIVSKSVLCDSELSPEAKAIYALLCCFSDKAGFCYPSVSLLCKMLNMDDRRLRRHMKPLIECGVVSKERAREGNLMQRNVYKIADDIRKPDSAIMVVSNSDPAISDASNPDPAISRQCISRPLQNGGVNNTIVRTEPKKDEQYQINKLSVYVCRCLNDRRAALSSKGRLKSHGIGEAEIRELLIAGISENAIMQRAEYLSKNGSLSELDWFSFVDAFLNRRHRPIRSYTRSK